MSRLAANCCCSMTITSTRLATESTDSNSRIMLKLCLGQGHPITASQGKFSDLDSKNREHQRLYIKFKAANESLEFEIEEPERSSAEYSSSSFGMNADDAAYQPVKETDEAMDVDDSTSQPRVLDRHKPRNGDVFDEEEMDIDDPMPSSKEEDIGNQAISFYPYEPSIDMVFHAGLPYKVEALLSIDDASRDARQLTFTFNIR